MERECPGVEFELRPVDLSAIQRAVGINPGSEAATVPNKRVYLRTELEMWAEWFGVPPLAPVPAEDAPLDKPVRTVYVAALSLAAAYPSLTRAINHSLWAAGEDIRSSAVLERIARGGGLSAPQLADALRVARAASQSGALSSAVVHNTREALQAGCTSVPMFDVVGDVAAVQNDHYGPLNTYLLEDWLAGWRPVGYTPRAGL